MDFQVMIPAQNSQFNNYYMNKVLVYKYSDTIEHNFYGFRTLGIRL